VIGVVVVAVVVRGNGWRREDGRNWSVFWLLQQERAGFR